MGYLRPWMQLASYLDCEKMVEKIDVSARAAAIEYAIRDVVVPAMKLESKGHEIIRLNVGDPLAFEGLPTPVHMIEAYKRALDSQDNGYGPSYGIPRLRQAIAAAETAKGWPCSEEDVYVTHGVTEALQIISPPSSRMEPRYWPPVHTIPHTWPTRRCMGPLPSNTASTRTMVGE